MPSLPPDTGATIRSATLRSANGRTPPPGPRLGAGAGHRRLPQPSRPLDPARVSLVPLTAPQVLGCDAAGRVEAMGEGVEGARHRGLGWWSTRSSPAGAARPALPPPRRLPGPQPAGRATPRRRPRRAGRGSRREPDRPAQFGSVMVCAPACPRRTSPPTGCSSPGPALPPACRCWSRGRAGGWRPLPFCSACRPGSQSSPPPGTLPSVARPRPWGRPQRRSIPAISRRPGSWSGAPAAGWTPVLDTVGEAAWGLSLRSVQPGGNGGGGESDQQGPMPGPASTGCSGASFTIAGTSMGTRQELKQLVGLCASGALRPLVDRVVTLEDTPLRLPSLAAGGQRGKPGRPALRWLTGTVGEIPAPRSRRSPDPPRRSASGRVHRHHLRGCAMGHPVLG